MFDYQTVLQILAVVLWPVCTYAASPRVDIGPSPTWKLPVKPGGHSLKNKEFSEGYYNSLVDLQNHVEQEAHYTHLVREIRTTEGVQNGSQISVYFNPAYERLTFHHVTLHRGGQTIEKLKPNAFKIAAVEAERDRFIYNDTYVASLVLADVRPGDQLEFDYTLTGENPVFKGRFSSDIYFSATERLPHRHHVLLVSPGRKLVFRSYHQPPKATESLQNGLKVYEWDMYDHKSPIKEPSEPDWNNTESHVQVSEYASWQEVVNWALPMYTIAAPAPALQARIAEWKKQASGNSLKYVQQAVMFVQNEVRYLGVEIGQYSHKPHNPEQVFQQRYGDCKDKSVLLCTLLQANQIVAYPALTSTYAHLQPNQSLPDPSAFNHAIVWLQVGGKEYWIDPTISHQRSTNGLFSVPLYGGALVLKPGEGTLRTVTTPPAGKIDITETFRIPAPNRVNGVGRLDVISVYSLNQADRIRAQLAENGLTSLENSYLDFYQNSYKDTEVGLLDSLNVNDQASPNEVTSYESYSIANAWSKDTTTGVATFAVVGRSFYDNFYQLSAEKRHQPLALAYPFEMNYTIRMQLPEAWNATDDQWFLKRNGYELSYARAYNSADSTLTLHYYYKALTDHLPADAVDTYRADVKKITDELEYQLTYNTEFGGQQGSVHWGSVLFYLLALAGFGYLCWHWYQYSPVPSQPTESAIPIGGWLLFVAFGVFLNPFLLLVEYFSSAIYLKTDNWDGLLHASSAKAAMLRVLIYIEGLGNLFLLCFSVLCGVLFAHKRSTFPRFYIVFLAGKLGYLLADVAAVKMLSDVTIDGEVGKNLVRAMFSALIWIPYFSRSTRVKQTFVNLLNPADYRPEQNPDEASEPIETALASKPTEHPAGKEPEPSDVKPDEGIDDGL